MNEILIKDQMKLVQDASFCKKKYKKLNCLDSVNSTNYEE